MGIGCCSTIITVVVLYVTGIIFSLDTDLRQFKVVLDQTTMPEIDNQIISVINKDLKVGDGKAVNQFKVDLDEHDSIWS